VYFEGSPLAKNFKALYGGAPLTLYVPVKIFMFYEIGKIKRKLFTKREIFAFTRGSRTTSREGTPP